MIEAIEGPDAGAHPGAVGQPATALHDVQTRDPGSQTPQQLDAAVT